MSCNPVVYGLLHTGFQWGVLQSMGLRGGERWQVLLNFEVGSEAEDSKGMLRLAGASVQQRSRPCW
jgi:hypothetical protein